MATDSVQPWDCLHPGLPTFPTTPGEEDLATTIRVGTYTSIRPLPTGGLSAHEIAKPRQPSATTASQCSR